MAKELSDGIRSVNESVSTVFRHILPGILIMAMSTLSIPSWLGSFDLTNTNTLILLTALAMVIGNVWYVFHRYFLLQLLDYLAYYFRLPGKPVPTKGNNFRRDIGNHVFKFFTAYGKNIAMAKHIRDRFSSFNYMFIASEALLLLTKLAEPGSFLAAWRSCGYFISVAAFCAAFWQYLIVRCIDAEFVDCTT